MASPQNSSDGIVRLAVSSLLSPPEPKRVDDLSPAMGPNPIRTPLMSFSSANVLPPISSLTSVAGAGSTGLPPSPPISPHTVLQKEDHNGQMGLNDNGLRDPQLFRPSDAAPAIPENMPLFPQEQVDPVVDRIVSDHIARRPSNKTVTGPTRDEYFLAISCVAKGFNRDPMAYYKREREILEQRYGFSRVVKPKSKLKRLAPAPINGTKKPRSIATQPRTPRVKRTPATKVRHSFDATSPTPAKAPRQPTNRDDVDYHALPDYAPPLSSLPNGHKALKAEWKGQMLDLSQDPDRDLLHEAEIHLAATLRLSCATYLCSKRRIFQARLEALRIGKEFRKTDAQQACKIDVNKASKLWSAYDRVGWFNPAHFASIL